MPFGGVDVNVIVWASPPTPIVCWTCGAAAYADDPAWLASRTQVPIGAENVTTPEELIVHPDVELASIESTTGLGDPPPFACAW